MISLCLGEVWPALSGIGAEAHGRANADPQNTSVDGGQSHLRHSRPWWLGAAR